MLHPRARTMLLLSLPAVAIGIASSLILIVVMKIASVLQNLLWQRLPGTLGIAQDSPLWIIGVLTLTGIAVGLVIRFSQGHAGPDPACEPLIGAPVPPSAVSTPPFSVLPQVLFVPPMNHTEEYQADIRYSSSYTVLLQTEDSIPHPAV